MKKIFAFSLISIFVFIIYICNIDNKIYFVDLSDYPLVNNTYLFKIENYLKEIKKLEKHISFSEKNLRTTDLIQKLENNDFIIKDNRKQTIKNALIKADIVIISVGSNDLFDHLLIEDNRKENYIYIKEYLKDVEELLRNIRLYCKENIYFLEIVNPQNKIKREYIDYINEQLKIICKNERITLITYQKELTNEMFNGNEINKKGQNVIYVKLLNQIKKTLLKK